MKRVFGLVLAFVFVSVLLVGCGNNNEGKKESGNAKIEAALKAAGEVYYEKHMRGAIGQTFNEITIALMENSAKYNSDIEYDLSALTNCDKTTSVTIEADENRNIVGYEYNIKC